jgi:hypothetical protein
MRYPVLSFALLSLLAVPALAPDSTAAAGTPERTTALVVYGNDPCPKAHGDDIVVCARRPEDERYRIPKALRRNRNALSETSLATRFADVEEQTRYTRPNSCSVVGTGGQTGCFEAMIRQWRAERREAQSEAASAP